MTEHQTADSTYRACGKLILLGEHFVVYGRPALALPVTSIATEVTVRRCPGEKPFVFHTDASEASQARELIRQAFVRLGIQPTPRAGSHWDLRARSSVPIGCGLGSSASFAVAALGALAKAAGLRVTADQLNSHAHHLERLVHGTPSGIDNTVVALGRPIWFRKEHPVELLDLPHGLMLLLASSGGPGSTKQAVARVQELRRADPRRFDGLCDQAQELAHQGRRAFAGRNLQRLGRVMQQNHELLRRIGVSTPRLDELVGLAHRAGAFGAKLTGAGQGGFVVALVDETTESAVTRAFADAGVTQVLATNAAGTRG